MRHPSSLDRRHPRARLWLAAALLLVAGCGSHPTTPIVLPPLARLSVSPETLAVQVGESRFLSAAAYDSAGNVVGRVPFQWTSSDSAGAILTVSSSGRVTGVGEGSARVFVEAGGIRDTSLVTVAPALSGWFLQPSNANGANLNGVFFQPDGRSGWAVGDAGKIVATTDAGAHWALQVSGTGFSLQGVWFSGAAEGWAVGNNGTVLHTVDGGAHWSSVNAGTSEALEDVTFATDSVGWAVGTHGLILRTIDRGTTWTKRFPTGVALHGIAFSGTLDGWAVGDQGVIVGTHDGGASWFVVQPAITTQSLRAVRRRSEAIAFAGGSQGVAPRTVAGPDSTVWQLQNAGAAAQLQGLHFPSDATGYAVGLNGIGTVLRTDDGGVHWQSQTANTQFGLNDVFFVDPDRGWAVGNNGTILHTGTGGRP